MSKWIKCSKRLPEEAGEYWIYPGFLHDHGKISSIYYVPGCRYNDIFLTERIHKVTHWMPKITPLPPKEEEA